jgi:SH3 domain-containing YSC84-like protein 1
MKKSAVVFLAFILMGTAVADRAEQVERLEAAGTVLDEIMAAPDKGIPGDVFGKAECVAVVPSMLKGGLVFGAKYGKGVATCRTEKGWSAPAFFSIRGGSWGLQLGGEAVDLVMLIMNEKGMRNLLSSKFKLSGEGSVAAGPVGRHASGQTDWKLRAQVLTYSRSRGAFIGLTLEGARINQHKDDTRDFYGRMVPFRTILSGQIAAPAESNAFLNTVAKHAGEPPLDQPPPQAPPPQAPPAQAPPPSN